MQCPVCNKEVAPDASFCIHCGASISPAAPPAYTPVTGASTPPPYAPVSGYNPPPSPPPPPAYSESYPPAGSYPPPAAGYSPPGGGYPPPAYPPPPAGGYPPPGSYPPPAGPSSSGLSNNTAAALAYITIIPAILFLVIEPYNKVPLVRFHSFQSIALCVVAFVVQVGVTIMSLFLHFIPFAWVLFSLLHLVIFAGLFILWLVAILKASKGEWYKIPGIGDFAEKQARG